MSYSKPLHFGLHALMQLAIPFEQIIAIDKPLLQALPSVFACLHFMFLCCLNCDFCDLGDEKQLFLRDTRDIRDIRDN
jgi:hypothetical protein